MNTQSDAPRRISFFPLPLPDELLDSVVSRYHHLSGNSSPLDSFQALYGKRRKVLPRLLFSSFDRLFERIPNGLFRDINDMIDRLTLVPAFSVLFSDQQVQQLRLSLHRDTKVNFATLHKIDRHVIHRNFQCCPVCVHEEMGRLGTAYWHRSHQLDGVVVCHRHCCNLISHCVHCGRPVRADRSIDMPCRCCLGCNRPLPTVFEYPESVRELSIRAFEAFSGGLAVCNKDWLANEILRKVQGKTSEFCAEALQRYGEKYCAPDRDSSLSLHGDWLKVALEPHISKYGRDRWRRIVPSLRHILIVSNSLFDSWADMVPPQTNFGAAA